MLILLFTNLKCFTDTLKQFVSLSELPTFTVSPTLSVFVSNDSKVSFVCNVQPMQRGGLHYTVDWFWGKHVLLAQNMSLANALYTGVLSEEQITRLDFGDEVSR